jgi:epoxyqueuosine reductase
MVADHHGANPVGWLKREIADFVATSPLNTLGLPSGEVAWDSPLVGFSRGDDGIYQEYKGHIGDFYWTPIEIFQLTFPDVSANPEDLTVISWVLPQTPVTKDENAEQKVFPSRRWTAARDLGEKFNVALRQHVVKIFLDKSVQAVAPMLSPHWCRQDSQGYGFASNWSERHAAHAGGLGTFGLCDGLITPVGKAIRTGSVVARLELAATPRPYQSETISKRPGATPGRNTAWKTKWAAVFARWEFPVSHTSPRPKRASFIQHFSVFRTDGGFSVQRLFLFCLTPEPDT